MDKTWGTDAAQWRQGQQMEHGVHFVQKATVHGGTTGCKSVRYSS
jgi:hypothetical protein